MKIVIFEAEPWEARAFKPLGVDHEVVVRGECLDASLAAEHADADIISCFIYSDLSRNVLEHFEGLGLIATRSTGFDHIDLQYCRNEGIQVANVPSYGENTVAEHVFALLLGISHHLVESVDRTRRGDFSLTGLQGFDLFEKTLGIVGAGNIGQHVARIGKGFGMKVLAHDAEPDCGAAATIGFEYVGMEDLLRESHVVTLHVPGNAETHHLIADREFDLMREGAILINTARGSVVHVRAMLRSLSSGKLAAAGLDVLPEEPVIREEAELLRAAFKREHDLEALLADHILLRLRNVIITPHNAFNTREAVERILSATRENIAAYLSSEPRNLVT